MSLELDEIMVQQFLSDAHAEFNSEGFLLDEAVRYKNGTKGTIINFPVFGRGVANQKSPQDDVTPLNIDDRNVTLTIQDWYAAEYVDRSFKNKLAVNATQEYSSLCAQSLGRRSDQMIIDVVEAANYGGGAGQGNQIAAGGTGFTYDKFKQAFRFLRQNAAAKDSLYCIMTAKGEQDLLGEEQVTSMDYIKQAAIAGNGLSGLSPLGVKIIVIPSMPEGGLTAGAAYMFNKNAVGFAANERLGGNISWENVKASYLINMWLEANAVVIDATGMVEILHTT
jgi:hypothetical protein